jgi:ribonucleotide reductase beta subunit family protein with ferritin-like domain
MEAAFAELKQELDDTARRNAHLTAKLMDMSSLMQAAGNTRASEAKEASIRVAGLDAHATALSPPASGGSPFNWAPGEKERLSLRPIRHEDIWAFRKKIEGLHWTAQEVPLEHDMKDWKNRMKEEERRFIKYQLAFFARIDIDVLDNLDENFGAEIDCLEARMVYAAQKDQECTHTESYGLQIEAVMTGTERDEVLNAVRTMPIIRKLREWVLRWFDRKLPIGVRLVAFSAVEGVLFSASFCALQWLRERNILPGITEYNTFIARDEGLHTLFTCLLIRRYLAERPCQAQAEDIYSSLVKLLDEFVTESQPVPLTGMSAAKMMTYVRFQADSVLLDAGYAALYNVENPFPMMDKLTLNAVAKTNFFERRGNQYQNITVAGQSALAIDASEVIV